MIAEYRFKKNIMINYNKIGNYEFKFYFCTLKIITII